MQDPISMSRFIILHLPTIHVITTYIDLALLKILIHFIVPALYFISLTTERFSILCFERISMINVFFSS